ncbi:hypothetical protein MtrunA17_Chr8g0364501 [Medicago truncatula]|uniref:Uncharacterized protein n=1 Tax=Medicago truncatula TaxID=3880 RepID=G7LFF1_MEDTR|nr:hypothetical protein MTR_8g063100 [Medicago truncatula]RHN41289.1 hypothetical protein MtrunA17_Chr8g0364501 [Medicago truncatula]
MDNTSNSQTSEHKEVKGVIDHDDPETVLETNSKTKEECRCKGKEDQNQKTKGLPHQQVPQSEDFENCFSDFKKFLIAHGDV